MGIFNDPKRLAKILASIKIHSEERPLKPIQVAKELQEACKELGGDEAATQKRFGLGKSMWSAFKRLLAISEDIQNEVKWGESDSTFLKLGFSASHVIAKFPKEEQNKLIAASWEYEQPLTHEDLEHIHSYKRNNPDKTIEECISEIFHVNHPKQEIIRLFVSGLDKKIFEHLKTESEKQRIPLKQFTKKVLDRKFSDGSIISVNPRETFIRITFSEDGKKEFERFFQNSKVDRNDFINYIFREEGFN